ncbi:GRRM system radical SAM/SPASM domain protein [Agrobacterium genomosp. 3]|uniref:cyclophane-forming radical SAM/SPASM peptide maturase GrrM/OscB n=1 Tax=Agrobacterium tomkonis TaxID=1183410 RepID=UPI001CD8B090|nr:GRRM system radical SAM/SPASM domain protein [Agrobacterium tomkonis]MCA1879918.1 GRRM system radical SAM/SPASM domain protein [Agrobacterium tumefaciens]MCA1895162.1 GRRM system radical SAM/SPASM domain protein [Agrobacterium tomkonis]
MQNLIVDQLRPRAAAVVDVRPRPSGASLALLVLQPTNFCNIDCAYCYLADRISKNMMSFDTAVAIARCIVDHRDQLAQKLVLAWHAGEPLTVGYDRMAAYFEAFSLLDEYGIRYQHSVQTNAMLMTPRFAELFARNGTKIGVSVDGTQAQHDLHRRTRSGAGTYAKVAHGIGVLREFGIVPSAISVVHGGTFADPDSYYDAIAELGIPYVGINVLELEGASKSSYLADETYMLRYRHFLERIYRRSLSDGAVAIRELVRALKWVMQSAQSAQSSEALPGRILTVAYNGDFSSFSPELVDHKAAGMGDFIIGNVHETSFTRALEAQNDLRFAADIVEGVAACRATCAYFDVCGGGAPANKLSEKGTFASSETAFCRYTIQAVLDVALGMIVAEPDLLRQAAATPWWRLVQDEPN